MMGIEQAQNAVARANHVLTMESYRAILALFVQLGETIPPEEWRERVSPEYGMDEYLACVNVDGEWVGVPQEAVEASRELSTAKPAFRDWFRVVEIETGQSTLLAARWLCHTLGLRHGTAHLVLCIPDNEDRFLLQVRSTRKITWPGCFDLPVAGHVDGLQSYEDTLRKEAKEELALDADRLVDLKVLGGYAASHGSNGGVLSDVEYHRVFSAKITQLAIQSLRPDPEEVASVLLMSGEELRRTLALHPERCAPGLTETLREFPV